MGASDNEWDMVRLLNIAFLWLSQLCFSPYCYLLLLFFLSVSFPVVFIFRTFLIIFDLLSHRQEWSLVPIWPWNSLLSYLSKRSHPAMVWTFLRSGCSSPLNAAHFEDSAAAGTPSTQSPPQTGLKCTSLWPSLASDSSTLDLQIFEVTSDVPLDPPLSRLEASLHLLFLLWHIDSLSAFLF